MVLYHLLEPLHLILHHLDIDLTGVSLEEIDLYVQDIKEIFEVPQGLFISYLLLVIVSFFDIILHNQSLYL